MRIIRPLLIALSLSFVLCPLSAKPVQIKGIPKDCKVHKPAYSQDFLNDELFASFISKGYESSEKTNLYWDVFSDRSNNVTYTSNSMDTPYSELGFKEKVRIARIRNGVALVYKANDIPSTFPQIPTGIEWAGWIPMANLIITEKVIVNDTGVPFSVLVKDKIDFDSKLKLDSKLYFNPTGKAEDISLPNCPNSIFYAVEQEGDFVLLATDPDISDASHIYGWMKWDDVQIWKTRIALEPTWDILDNAFFSQSDHTSLIQGANEETIGSIDFVRGQDGAKFTPEYRRLPSGSWRYPIIYNTPDFSLCAIPGQSSFLNNPSLRIPVLAGQDASEDSFNLVPDSSDEGINIMFVIDGSRLYEPFFPILAERLSLLGNANGLSRIKAGALIYHDSRSGENMTELHELTKPDDASLYEFIDMGGLYGFKDNLSEAPLLTALDEVIDNAGFDAQAQNFIILIGGRGDSSDSHLIPSGIAQRLSDGNIGLYALQVQNNSGTAAYRLFGYLLDDIIRQSVERKLETSVSAMCETNAEYSFITYYGDSSNSTEVFDGYQAINSGLMSEEDFDVNLEMILQRVNRSVDSSVGHSANLSSAYPQFFRTGTLESVWNGRKPFKQVALFSSNDFDWLLTLYGRLNGMHLISLVNRDEFVSILMEYLPPFFKIEGANSYYPYNKMNEEAAAAGIKKMGLYQLLSLIEGVQVENAYPGPALKDILSPKVVSNEEFLSILADFSRRYYRLLTIRNTPALYSTYINDQTYFWIPCEDLL